jgi:Glycosyltransferase Family 4
MVAFITMPGCKAKKDQRMNVLFVNNFRSRGGGEEFLCEILPGLADKGVKVGLVCRPGTPLEKMFRKTSIEVYPISRSGMRAITSVFTIAGIIRNNRYELIDIQRGHDIIQSWAASLLSARNPKLVYTVHVAHFMQSRFLLNRMHRIITVSRYLGQKIASLSPALSGAVKIIHHGIDLTRFKTTER